MNCPQWLTRLYQSWPVQTLLVGPLRFTVSRVMVTLFSIIVLARIATWVVGPPSYRVYIIGDFTNTPKHGSVRKGFNPDKSFSQTIDGCSVTVAAKDDKGSEKLALEIAQDLVARSDTLLVVGHMRSTMTRAALPEYLRREPPIPVILTLETNPDLAPAPDPRELDYPVVRLSATDTAQARQAAAFALGRGAKTFWIIQDPFNPVYSKFLADEFKQVIHRSQAKVLLWTLTEPPREIVGALNVDCLFFAGYWSNGLIAVRQARKFPGQAPRLFLLSEASVEPDLLTAGGGDVEGVHLMHQLEATQFQPGVSPYELFGRDARLMAEWLVEQTSSRFEWRRKKVHWLDYWMKKTLSLHRVADAREVLNEVVRGLPRMRREEQGTEEFTYRAETGLSGSNRGFHVMQVQQGQFKDVPHP